LVLCDVTGQQPGSGRRPTERVQVLERDGNAMQRASPSAFCNLRLRLARLREGLVGENRVVRAEVRVESLNPGEDRSGDLDRRHLAQAKLFAHLEERGVMQAARDGHVSRSGGAGSPASCCAIRIQASSAGYAAA